MLHSTYSHKETNEDRKTSSIFENLMLLPDNVFWHILRTSCFYNERMFKISGQLLDYQFWCHWDRTGTDNTNYVEPDVFLRFEHFDVIIEAKYTDWGGQYVQYEQQWKQEITAYLNEYGNEEKPVIFIAIGGNLSVDVEEVKIRGSKYSIFKCNWSSILISINKYRNELARVSVPETHISATLRLIDNIILAFNINGVYNIDWFNSMIREDAVIRSSSIDALQNYFQYE